MGENSLIEWCDATWSPVTGCTPVSEGCANCYARRMATRLAGRYGYPSDEPFRVTLHPDRLDEPLRWRKPRRVFVCSMGDLFHEDVPNEFIDRVFGMIALSPQHIFQILTKRPDRMRRFLDTDAEREDYRWAHIEVAARRIYRNLTGRQIPGRVLVGPIGNTWLGVTAENQAAADERIPILLSTPAAVRFVSAEPVLGPTSLLDYMMGYQDDDVSGGRYVKLPSLSPYFSQQKKLHWVICGCESGPNARPCKIEWARDLKDQCVEAGVPFFYKRGPGDDGKVVKMPMLDGRTWAESPKPGVEP